MPTEQGFESWTYEQGCDAPPRKVLDIEQCFGVWLTMPHNAHHHYFCPLTTCHLCCATQMCLPAAPPLILGTFVAFEVQAGSKNLIERAFKGRFAQAKTTSLNSTCFA
jgi:hypothetical protein